jgi:hypothetical protein
MRRFALQAAMTAILTAPLVPALAQTPTSATGARPGNEIGTGQSLPLSDRASNINSSNVRSTIAPRLPSPDLPDGSGPRDYLMAADTALRAHRTGVAQEALERAESRALDGSVVMSQANQPSRNALVQTISSARQALASGNQAAALDLIAAAMKDPASANR